MYNIAIVEDDKKFSEQLMLYLRKFQEENNIHLSCGIFNNGVDFLENYQFQYDIVFMDIDLPEMNGMTIAKKLRDKDNQIVLIFITVLSQFAINGYEVGALDYILKPYNYPLLLLKLRRAIDICKKNKTSDLMLKTNNGIVRINTKEIKYVEIYNHNIIFYSETGNYTTYGTLKNIITMLPRHEFFRCNNSYIINLRHVREIIGMDTIVGDKIIPISRMRKKDFITALHCYYSKSLE